MNLNESLVKIIMSKTEVIGSKRAAKIFQHFYKIKMKAVVIFVADNYFGISDFSAISN